MKNNKPCGLDYLRNEFPRAPDRIFGGLQGPDAI